MSRIKKSLGRAWCDAAQGPHYGAHHTFGIRSPACQATARTRKALMVLNVTQNTTTFPGILKSRTRNTISSVLESDVLQKSTLQIRSLGTSPSGLN